MLEIFIVYLWENRLLRLPLITTAAEQIEIIFPGKKNTNSGPDFLNAQVKIGGVHWVGNIEIHINASDWYRHHHQTDPAFNNVVLHVVYLADKQVFDSNGNAVPTLEVKGKFEPSLLLNYRQFLDSRHFIPCQNQITFIQHFTWLSWLDRMAVERLEEKVEIVLQIFKQSNNDWEETFYQMLMKNFGLKVNDSAFQMLARQLPFHLLLKHADRLDQLEALLFGVAGLLDSNYSDQYPKQLKSEFLFLQNKYALPVMPSSVWRFMRMRPINFPTIRLSQFAALVHVNGRIFSKILSAEDTSEIIAMFNVKAGHYWDSHYRFDVPSKEKPKYLGKEAATLMIINSVAQMLFAYGIYTEQRVFCDRSFALLEKIDPERNSMISNFRQIGLPASSALHTQGLIHLKRNYCDQRRCLDCRIGHLLLNLKK